MLSARNAMIYASFAVLAPSAALAQAQSYVGKWAAEAAQCKLGQEDENAPLIMKKNGYDRHETHCKFSSVRLQGSSWKVKGSCDVEGDKQDIDLTLTVAGSKLTMRDAQGSSSYQRCR